ncbi:MAG: uracil-DNA glycosylase [Thiotrichales bacterium]|nr:uracil-DNA glycosylase [Thiotrichales bacterium]
MPVTEHYETLRAMGIDVWIERKPQASPVSELVGPDLLLDTPGTAPHKSPQTGAGDALSMLDWEPLARRVAGCEACELCQTRNRTVFGVGDRGADILVVGEAPGADEDRQGEPFVGRAGQLLNAMLKSIGLSREQVYITNILKCRPPDNRDPLPPEIESCESYLLRQIALLKPKVILASGRIAAQSLLRSNQTIGRLRGQRHVYADTGVPLIATYHPAYLLRSPSAKGKSWDDLKLLREVAGL